MKKDNATNGRVIPMRKADRFGVYLGEITPDGEIIQGESVGLAFLKVNAKTFRLKLWVFPSHQYFIAPDDEDRTRYVVLALDEYQLPTGETVTNWNRVGEGRLQGSFIRLRIQLFRDELFLCLFPEEAEPKEDVVAS